MGISILLSMLGGAEWCNDDRKAVVQESCMEGGVLGEVCVTWQRQGGVDVALLPGRPGHSGCSVSIVQEAMGERGFNQSDARPKSGNTAWGFLEHRITHTHTHTHVTLQTRRLMHEQIT